MDTSSVFSGLVFSQSQGLISKVLATKYMVWLGGISFEIYIFHWVMKRFVISIEQLLQIELDIDICVFSSFVNIHNCD